MKTIVWKKSKLIFLFSTWIVYQYRLEVADKIVNLKRDLKT